MNACSIFHLPFSFTRLAFIVGALGVTRIVSAAPESPKPAVPDALAEARPILQSGYVDYAGLQIQPGDHLDDVVRKSQGEILLSAAVPAPAPSTPIIATLLPGGTIYCRFVTFGAAANWSALATELKTWAAQGAAGVIVDLRSTDVPDDFDGAAHTASLFISPAIPLFTIKNAQADMRAYVSASPAPGVNPPLVNGPLAVLTNEQTSGAAEALAACLKANGALTLGRWTSGNGAQFAEHPLVSGRVLRYVSGQVTMADGSPLWRHSVEPDIGLRADPKKEAVVLGLIAQSRVLDVIRESTGSHRLSEAALVQGEEPAVEAYLVPSVKPSLVTTPQDSILVAALDSLKAIRVSQETPAAAAAAAPKIPTITQ